MGAQNGATSWNGWYAQFFSFLQANPDVKQFNYIDWNWANSYTVAAMDRSLRPH